MNRSVFLDTKCALISFQLCKIKQAGISLSGCSAFIPHNWPCLPVTPFHCTRQSCNCFSMFISLIPPALSISLLLSLLLRQWNAETGGRENSKNPPLLTRTKMNCVRVQSPIVALVWNHCFWFLPRRLSAGEL